MEEKKYIFDFDHAQALENILRSLSDSEEYYLIAVSILPRDGEIGMLEERGDWIKNVWNSVATNCKETSGCRIGWTVLFFATDKEKENKTVERIKEILARSRDPLLESYCVVSVSKKGENALANLEAISNETSSRRDFGTEKTVTLRFRDGEPV